jgi:serine/threonine protein kinase
VNALKAFNHPNILNLVDVYEDDVCVYLITDYCSHGDLANLIINKGKLPEQSVKSTIKQILQAVQYIHKLGFIHQDLKPDNIFIEERNGKQNHIVVGDFGSCILEDDITRYRTGTFQYIAPELKQGRLPSFASDAWSIGIILHTCIFGVYPVYQDPEQNEIDWNHEMYTQMALEIKNVLQGLLQNDSDQRLTCTEALEMPFFKETPTPKKLGCCRIS